MNLHWLMAVLSGKAGACVCACERGYLRGGCGSGSVDIASLRLLFGADYFCLSEEFFYQNYYLFKILHA